jgi:hypothetical protein
MFTSFQPLLLRHKVASDFPLAGGMLAGGTPGHGASTDRDRV